MSSGFCKNLKLLSEKYSQKAIAVKTGFSQASINNYVGGISEPSISFLVELKNAFGIDIDDFLFGQYDNKESVVSEKFLGHYIVYYYNNTSYKGEVHNNITNTLNYGVLSVYKDESKNVKACATYTQSKKDSVTLLNNIKELADGKRIMEMHNAYNNFYSGTITQSHQNLFINIENYENGDVSYMIFNNPPSLKKYIGGIGTVNTVSRGREHNPCVQLIMISKNVIDKSDGEIYSCLQLDVPHVELVEQTKEIINLVKRLYMDNDKLIDNLTDIQKESIVENNIKYIFSEVIDANMFRFAKVSNREDDHIYNMIRKGEDGD